MQAESVFGRTSLSNESYYRRPRRHCADQVFITSTSILFFPDNEISVLNEKKNEARLEEVVTLRLFSYTGIYETQEVISYLEKEGLPSPASSASDNHTYQDIPLDDDFSDSDQSMTSRYNEPLPAPPSPPPASNIYGITKHKLNKLRKSLMKSTLRGPKTKPLLQESSPVYPQEPISLPAVPTQQSSQNSRKYFSLRKFRRSLTTIDHSSTFYLSPPSPSTASQPNLSLQPPSPPSRKTPPPLPTSPPPKLFNKPNIEVLTKINTLSSSSNSITLLKEKPTEEELLSIDKALVENRVVEKVTPINKGINVVTLPNLTVVHKGLEDSSPSPPPRRSPPPLPTSPPPLLASKNIDNKPSASNWYSECGLFDSTEDKRDSMSCWYADVGLYSKAAPCFVDEPLYQFYTASVTELARQDCEHYIDIEESNVRPTAMQLKHRSLWCEIPEVIASCVLSTLNVHQKKLQEAKFEIIASEASYLKSLTILEDHFMASPEFNDDSVISKSNRRILFGNVAPVKICSFNFLAQLDACWQNNVLLNDICEVVYKYATNNFDSYVKYCSNQIYLDRTLRLLKNQRGRFNEVLTQLERSSKCQHLSLHSFLMLPMQRITRLPLLLDAVLTRLTRSDAEYETCELALSRLNSIVQQCNEGARKMERMEEILILSQQLDFPKDIKPIPIISSSRWLVRSGEVTQLIFREDSKLTFGRKFSKTTLHVFLFTDLLVLTKKKSEDSFIVIDYCQRSLVELTDGLMLTHLPVKTLVEGGKNLMLLTLLRNHEQKTAEMVLSCRLESDKVRWLSAMTQPTADNPDESVYSDWDCPQVQTTHSFSVSQPDELALENGDVVNVLKKTPDGWFYGQRLRDNNSGWFPGNHTIEVASAHVRAKNIKQRYRLLALSGNFLSKHQRSKK